MRYPATEQAASSLRPLRSPRPLRYSFSFSKSTISYRQRISAVFRSIAATEQYFSSLSAIAFFTASSVTFPPTRNSNSIFVHTCGGSVARSPEQITSSFSSFSRFFSRIITTSVAVHAPSAISSNSVGPQPTFVVRSASSTSAGPEGPFATNSCLPIHRISAVCITPPAKSPSLLIPPAAPATMERTIAFECLSQRIAKKLIFLLTAASIVLYSYLCREVRLAVSPNLLTATSSTGTLACADFSPSAARPSSSLDASERATFYVSIVVTTSRV